MYCSNCGKNLREDSQSCSSCGSKVISPELLERYSDGKFNVADKVNGSRIFGQQQENDWKSDVKDENNPFYSEEVITVREREKRIIVEKIRAQIDSAKEERRINEIESLRKTALEKQKADDEKAMDVENIKAAIESQKKADKEKEGVNIKIEQKIIGKSKPKKIRSKSRRVFFKILFYLGGITIFLLCMGYLFWRFAPPNDIYKNEFVKWSSANLNKNVNHFLFSTMRLNAYYAPPKIVDYSGVYLNTFNPSGEKTYLIHDGMNLSGHYVINENSYELKGFADNKGALLLLETLDGIPSGIIRGTIFSTGYIAAERYDQNGGQKMILSLQKDQTAPVPHDAPKIAEDDVNTSDSE